MEQDIRYRGKTYSHKDISFIRQLIADNPDASRWALSRKLCIAWGWTQKNGALCDQICRSFMLELDRAGHISLPPRKRTPFNYLANRRKPPKVEIDQAPLEATLSAIKPLQLFDVRREKNENLCNSLIEQYHYLGYCHPVGEHVKYMVYAGQKPIACMTWSSVPRHIGCRDRFIGWPKTVREKNLHYIAYNSRFLILPWVHVKYLASHILALVIRQISDDWQKRYRHGVYYLETFVDKERFAGICYQASNWIYLGDTTGRGKNDHSHKANRSIKAVYGYPLTKDFRDKLCGRKKDAIPTLKKSTGKS
jgi:hypothetical protein